jgi:teichuronic acid biosynthesis glycosyltransferase TuaG
MDKVPLVSVIIPTYNHADFIREALESLVAQTFENWEAIVVNNFSEDETVSVVESFKDSRIKLENFRNHGVIAASRNRAIELAQGEYLAFLDSDDTWFPEKLKTCFGYLSDDVDLVCHGLRTFGDGPEYEFFGGPESRATFESLLYEGNCLTPSATVVRKESVLAVGSFSVDKEKVTSEDYHLWIKLAKSGVRMKFVGEILGLYRIHTANQSGSVFRHLNSIISVIEDFFPSPSERSFLDAVKIKRRVSLAFYGAARALQKEGEYRAAWAALYKAVVSWPLYVKVYVAILVNLFSYPRRG